MRRCAVVELGMVELGMVALGTVLAQAGISATDALARLRTYAFVNPTPAHRRRP